MCYSGNCKYEMKTGPDAGECRKPRHVQLCPDEESGIDYIMENLVDEADYLRDRQREELYVD